MQVQKVREISGLFRPRHLRMDAQRDRATALSDVTEAAVAELVVSRQKDRQTVAWMKDGLRF